jgi:hypothetical protein
MENALNSEKSMKTDPISVKADQQEIFFGPLFLF